ncbi:MAG: YkgJ family cysteine cluster protein [Agathobacter sp.]|nr:YkgJ family cysteine cluster protein [Agathobacter sp.]
MEKDLLEISDGKLYGSNDMAKVSCHDCNGCSSCCQDMGQSIWLDPYDIYQLTKNLEKTMEELLTREIELHVEDGLILPNLKMVGESSPQCGFLNEAGRCSIHGFRPGYCRLFPLGRNYEEDKLTYFVLKDACLAPNKSKVKISKWLGVPRLKEYERFLVEWHRLTKYLRAFYGEHVEEEAVIKAINIQFLQIFYLTPYDSDDFYEDFHSRRKKMQAVLEAMGVSGEI